MADAMDRDTEAYLARIRRTIAESSRLVEQAGLRIAETDRMLESQGLTRDEVMNFHFTEAQREAVNRELVRRGMEPLEDESEIASRRAAEDAAIEDARIRDRATLAETEPDDALTERQRKFGMMMKPFQL